VVIRIGTSGWSYDHWHPELYTSGLPVRDRLARYAAAFPTAELNSSFYRWPRPAAFRSWQDRLPQDFRLSASRADPCPQAVRAGGLAAAHRGGLARAG
jgi:uncharacterized protein YecE (DUF72 family)